MSNPIPESGHGPACDPAKDAFWRRTLADFKASRRNIREFCRERGLGESAFYAWRRTIAQRDGLLAGHDRKTAAAVSKKPAAAKKPVPAFLPVKVKPALPPAAVGEALRVELRGGRVLVLPASLPAMKLAEVLHALEGFGGEGRA